MVWHHFICVEGEHVMSGMMVKFDKTPWRFIRAKGGYQLWQQLLAEIAKPIMQVTRLALDGAEHGSLIVR